MSGWFNIEGIQDGPRTLAEQLIGLDHVLRCARRATVLDLGCAEGLIARHFCESGAVLAHGVDCNYKLMDVAQEACKGWPIELMIADLRDRKAIARLPLLGQYDIVLALSILHKMTEPPGLLRFAAAKAKAWLAIRLPERVLFDRRSGFRPFDIPALLSAEFDLVGEPAGPRGEWVGLFRRRVGSAGPGV